MTLRPLSEEAGKTWNSRQFVHGTRAWEQQGYTMQRTAYCQLIRGTKKAKRLELAQRILESGNTFHNMIISDECSISPPLFMCGGNQ